MNPTAFPNLDQPVVDLRTGKITKPWYQLIASLYLLLGGSNPVSTPDLGVTAGLMDENFSATIELENAVEAFRNGQSMDDALLARVTEYAKSLNDMLANLATAAESTARIAELEKRLADIEATQVFAPVGPQPINLSGDVSGYGSNSITVTLSPSGVAAGTYQGLTLDAKGRVIAASSVPYARTDQSNSWVSAQSLPSGSKILSGSSTYSYGAVGRTGNDFVYGVAGAANDLVNGSAAGDTVLNANVAGANIIVAVNGTEVARHSSDGGFRCAQLRTTQTPTASSTASDHSVPISLNGTTYYMRLSSTA